MNSRSLQYIVTIAEEQSISKAAQKLYISQPSLSQYVKKLEQSLGVSLFDRSMPLELTYSGERYVEAAKRILDIEKQLMREIEDIIDFKKGRLIIGIPHYRGKHILPVVMPLFVEKFPGFEVIVVEETSSILEEIAVKGDIDLIMLYLPINNDHLAYEPILSEKVLVAVPENHLPPSLYRNSHEANDKRIHPPIQLSSLKELPFVMSKPNQRLRQIANSLFKEEGIKPNIIFESVYIDTLYNLTAAGMGISFIPYSFIPEVSGLTSGIKQTPVYFFSLDNHASTSSWTLAAAYHKDKYMTKAGSEFIAIVKEKFWQNK